MPDELEVVEKEWNTAKIYFSERYENLKKYAHKMLDPGPKGL